MKSLNYFLYNSNDGAVSINAIVKDETIWLTQKTMGELFDVNPQAITKHLENIFKEGELEEPATCSILEQVQTEGHRQVVRKLKFYNLDAIISVGYRVNSRRATDFRIWATKVLKEYLTKGFVLDDERLKNGQKVFDKDYFRELLERVRSIRASERRIYQQITDIFAECSIDYNNRDEIAKNFYAEIQNKFHYAITGKTAAEIIHEKADHKSANMGLSTWKNSPDGRILKSDTLIAKNYLSEQEIRRLERTVSGYFDYIEDLIERENTFTMAEFSKSVNEFLNFRRYQILPDHGKISMEKAREKASLEYDEFNKTQKILSDFDKSLKNRLKEGDKK